MTRRLPVLLRPLVDRVTDERHHAWRVSLGLVLPGALLVVFGRPELIIYAVFGSFTGMYGRTESRLVRMSHQTQGAMLLLSGSAVGIALRQSHARPAVVILAATGFAIAGSMVADFFALKPEGPFYGVFALGALAGIPNSLVAPSEAFLITGASAVLAVALGFFSASRTQVEMKNLADAWRQLRVRELRQALVHALRYAVAVAGSGFLALFVGLDHVNWAIAGAAVTLAAADPRGRFWRGIHRVLGTVIGLGVTALLLLPGFGPGTLAIIVIVLLFPTELFMSVSYALALSFFTPMIMLMTELAAPLGVGELLETRALGTLVGVLTGFAVTYVIRDRTGRSAAESDQSDDEVDAGGG